MSIREFFGRGARSALCAVLAAGAGLGAAGDVSFMNYSVDYVVINGVVKQQTKGNPYVTPSADTQMTKGDSATWSVTSRPEGCVVKEWRIWNASRNADKTAYGLQSGYLSYTDSSATVRADGDLFSSGQWYHLDVHFVWLTYTLRYSTGSPAAVAYGYTNKVALAECAQTKTGYSFGGWTGAGLGSPLAAGTQVTGKTFGLQDGGTTVELSPAWEANRYTVTFDRQSGSGGAASVDATYDAAMPPAAMPTRAGYAFAGYWSEPGGQGARYYTASGASARTWNLASDAKLYAHWTAGSYTVTLDRQSGSGGTASVGVTFGAAMPSVVVPTRTGYAFAGYWSAANGQGAQYYYADGSGARAWDQAQPATLYACWTAQGGTVTFDRSGGSGGSGTVEATYGAALPSVVPPTRTGYVFAGYYQYGSQTGKQYYSAQGVGLLPWDQTAAATLYAGWDPIAYTVHYDGNGATGGSMADSAHTYDLSAPLSANGFVRSGGTFLGWATSPDGAKAYDNQASVRNLTSVPDGSVTLYAVWSLQAYGVAATAEQGRVTRSPAKASYAYGATVTLTVSPVEGYAFAYWDDDERAGNPRSVTVTGEAEYRAVCTARVYTVTFDARGGTLPAGSGTKRVTYGGYFGVLPTPTLAGYVFRGWYDDPRSGTAYRQTASYGFPFDLTLYAQWDEAERYAVSVHSEPAAGGAVSGAGSYYDGETATLTAVPAAGYSFARWSDDPSAANPRAVMVYNRPAAYTAVFTGNVYRAAFLYANGTPDGETRFVTHGGTWGALPEPTYARHALAGWYTAPDGGGARLSPEDEVTATDDSSVFYAHWTDGPSYVVAFDGGARATGEMPSVKRYCGESEALPANGFVRTGYAFAGWSESEEAAGRLEVRYADRAVVGDLAAADETNTLYAAWSANAYAVVFDANGGTGAMPTQVLRYDTPATLASNAFARALHAFRGWAESPAAAAAWADGASVTNLASEGSVTLYAVWEDLRNELNRATGFDGAVLESATWTVASWADAPEGDTVAQSSGGMGSLMTADLEGPGELAFDWLCASAAHPTADYFYYVAPDGTGRASPGLRPTDTAWTGVRVQIPSGKWKVAWQGVLNARFQQQKLWVDRIRWTPRTAAGTAFWLW